jgi:hypothetical protein
MKYALFFLIACLVSCVKGTNSNEGTITFAKYYKDSAYFCKFKYRHEGKTFRYTSLKHIIHFPYIYNYKI